MKQFMNTWRTYIKESAGVNMTFEDILEKAPEELRDILEALKSNRENPRYHPEGSTYEHIRIVTSRLIESGDIDLIMSGFFHDLGKLATKSTDENGVSHAYGHEKVSAKLVEKYADWVREMGADPQNVHEIVSQHMRAHGLEQMGQKKQDALRASPNFDKLMTFRVADDMLDRGGKHG